jgi:hypothetical protein
MASKLQILLYAALLASLTTRADIARADNRCDATTSAAIQRILPLVDSIRIDKPGLARVYAVDGTEFTAGEGRWMKAQVLEIEKACVSGDQANAALRLAAIQSLVTAHTR